MITWSGRNGLSDYAHNFDKNNFGPRVGFAYRATDKWVIRGGGGVLYVGQYDQATPILANIGFSLRSDVDFAGWRPYTGVPVAGWSAAGADSV